MLSNDMACATVEGALKYGVIVGAKHFAFNDQETQRSGVATYMTEQKAREGELRSFQGAVEDSDILGMMSSFTRIRAASVNGSVALLRNILRDEWGYKGLISTDMVNNTGYFRPEMCIHAGVTMMADFSTNETMQQVTESWPYMTKELISKDENLASMAKDDMKYQLYAYAHSAAQNVKTVEVTPWWEMTMNVIFYISIGLSVLSLALYAAFFIKGKKEEN
ncbi:glycoside hydrolase family 3 N-terminal domain-containing protein [Clostridium sp. C105KSO13]|uniref:glycoside hydrolase family 3 N-terminal domain-containing protein n=1 Tax=Clostridium sp. C105KSO13 TaxID=1776045 RepID=UPI0007406666|nr:glycoside hydrolase family 3 N-terminal domain-containing protein [Clostridium sp. C105KSO13]CUX45866.1 Exo-alpha-(1->6)-L-arabinopyranosidase [Clostridium sp. C105KSO13]